jgi:hypothetical protein
VLHRAERILQVKQQDSKRDTLRLSLLDQRVKKEHILGTTVKRHEALLPCVQ